MSQVVNTLLDELFPPTPLLPSATVANENESVHSPIQIIAERGWDFVESAFVYCAKIYTIWVENEEGSLDDGAGKMTKTTTTTTTTLTTTRRYCYISQGVQGLFKDVLLCGEVLPPIPPIVDEPEQREQEQE